MTSRQRDHIKFLNETEKIVPGFKKNFRRAVKKAAKETQGMNMIQFFKYCSI